MTFDPPDNVVSYRGPTNPPCGSDRRALPRNAVYCSVDQHVAYDLDWLQEYLADYPGGATTFLIISHEWGHAVQNTWIQSGGDDTWLPSYNKELDADCLAGVFLAHEIASGAIEEEDGDADAIFTQLYSGGSTDWLGRPGDHGTQKQRQLAFADGYTSGTDYCRTTY